MTDKIDSQSYVKELAGPESESFLIDKQDDDGQTESRDTWANRAEFVLALIGYTVGIGSIWRFPILCVRNGGGAFLIPFILNVAFVVGPLYYLEINLGQFTGKSPCKAYEYCPLIKGMGYLSLVMILLTQYYFITIMSWILYYLYSSFSSVLPWTTCNNPWNTPNCYSISETLARESVDKNISTDSNLTKTVFNTSEKSTATFEFWNNNVLHRSGGLEEIGFVQIHLAVALFIAWLMTVLGIIKGVNSLGKVVYVTVLFPYVLLTVLLIRGLTLEGSMDGIMYLLKFDIEKLGKVQVWLEASIQVFYSMGPAWGGVIAMSARNKYHQPALKNTVIVCVAEIFTAVFASFVLFAVIGFMAKEVGEPVEELAKASGVGLAFLAYPTAASLMPFPQLWAVLFFLMMVLVMVDCLFGIVESIIYCLEDLIPFRWKHKTVSLTIGYAVLMFVFGLVFVTEGGIYLFQLLDWYVSIFGIFVGALMEVISISLVYGMDRFSEDISTMSGKQVSVLARILFCIIIPIVAFVTFVLMLTQYSEPNYGDGYQYKPYAISIGFTLSLLPVISGILPSVYELHKQKGGLFTSMKQCLEPSTKWMSRDRKVREMNRRYPYIYQPTFFGRLRVNILGHKETPFIY